MSAKTSLFLYLLISTVLCIAIAGCPGSEPPDSSVTPPPRGDGEQDFDDPTPPSQEDAFLASSPSHLDGSIQGDAEATSDAEPAANVPPSPSIQIKAGSFFMGSKTKEAGRGRDEVFHRVTITRPFFLGESEVTRDEWQTLMKRNPSPFLKCGGSCPAVQVSWWDALAYCNARSISEGFEECYDLSECRGKVARGRISSCTTIGFERGVECDGYRLPTEAEWEYAARAGTFKATPLRDIRPAFLGCRQPHAPLDSIAWFCGNADYQLHEVRTRASNRWGLYDMHGNVWEWVWDRYAALGRRPATDPLGPEEGGDRVLRGGSWFVSARLARSAARWHITPDFRADDIGFRVARTVQISPDEGAETGPPSPPR